MTAKMNEIRTAYEAAIGFFGFEKACEILGIILNNEVEAQNITADQAKVYYIDFTMAS